MQKKIECDNGVAPANAYSNNAHRGSAAEALNNLDAATAANCQAAANQAEVVANLAGANQQLANQLQQSQQQIHQIMANLHLPVTAPARRYQPPPQNPTPVASNTPAPPTPALLNQGYLNKVQRNQPPRAIRRWDNNNYCSSCSFDVAEWHNIHTCPPSRRRPDHNEQATRANTIGGSEKNPALVGL